MEKVTVVLGGKSFELGYPNIGQYITIEALKQSLTNGRYALIAFGALKTGNIALDFLDACIYFGTINPDILKHFKVDGVKELTDKPTHTEEMKELLDQYTKVFSPFFDSIEIRADRIQTPQTIHEQEEVEQSKTTSDKKDA